MDDRWVRWVLFHYVFGCVLALQLLFISEVLAPMPFSPPTKVILATVVTPLVILLIGAARQWRERG